MTHVQIRIRNVGECIGIAIRMNREQRNYVMQFIKDNMPDNDFMQAEQIFAMADKVAPC